MAATAQMFAPGQKIFVRSVTYRLLGEIVHRDGDWLELKHASWIADSGSRFHQTIGSGSLDEVDYVGRAYVNLAAVVDAFPWKHDLPLASK